MMRHVPTGYADSKLAAAILNRELAERYKVSAWNTFESKYQACG